MDECGGGKQAIDDGQRVRHLKAPPEIADRCIDI
jgi:hypothetical protein